MNSISEIIAMYFCRSSSERQIRRLRATVRKINGFEETLQALSDGELRGKTAEFRSRLAAGESVDDLLCEAFATVKSACRRLCGKTFTVCGIPLVWDMVPYDEQILAGIVLHRGGIAEMATGEGKTLAAAMPLYLNALEGKGAHLVTVNDYLAQRDSEWIGGIFRFLGLEVGCILTNQLPAARRAAYAADITYGTNSEFGFDYLRDNGLAFSRQEQVQRGHHYAIVDEVDSVLIDEARTPLIIAGESVETENPFLPLKQTVQSLMSAQRTVLAKLLDEAALPLKNGDLKSALPKLLQVRMGSPCSPQLGKILEQSKIRHALDSFDTQMHASQATDELNELKKELYFTIDEKHREIELSDIGYALLDRSGRGMFVVPDYLKELQALRERRASPEEEERFKLEYADKINNIHNLRQLMLAYCLFEKDIHYIVGDGQILIVDEHTGRALPGRRFTDGLHQALEAKENVRLSEENVTYASITQQNYFRLYRKLAGMTGTALSEAAEFYNIYKMTAVAIPTHRPVRRESAPDRIFRTKKDKFNAVVAEVEQVRQTGRPVLLGTPSVEDSEILSRLLSRKRIAHQVLNAKQNQREAEIIAGAGQKGCVTVATNMAGRGTDIKLGPGTVELGGLYVIGSSRHDARRIDRQLAGRCARQGDPGGVQFFVSLEDEFIRLFGPERLVGIFGRIDREVPELAHEHLDTWIKKAQKALEMRHYSMRKQTLDFDDVMNKHREVIYNFRGRVMDGGGEELLHDFVFELVSGILERYAQERDEYSTTQKDWATVAGRVGVASGYLLTPEVFGLTDRDEFPGGRRGGALLEEKISAWRTAKLAALPEDFREKALRLVLFRAIDSAWVDHLSGMEQLRDTVWFQSYAQRDPLTVYKTEGYALFRQLVMEIAKKAVSGVRDLISGLEIQPGAPAAPGQIRRKIQALKHG